MSAVEMIHSSETSASIAEQQQDAGSAIQSETVVLSSDAVVKSPSDQTEHKKNKKRAQNVTINDQPQEIPSEGKESDESPEKMQKIENSEQAAENNEEAEAPSATEVNEKIKAEPTVTDEHAPEACADKPNEQNCETKKEV